VSCPPLKKRNRGLNEEKVKLVFPLDQRGTVGSHAERKEGLTVARLESRGKGGRWKKDTDVCICLKRQEKKGEGYENCDFKKGGGFSKGSKVQFRRRAYVSC